MVPFYTCMHIGSRRWMRKLPNCLCYMAVTNFYCIQFGFPLVWILNVIAWLWKCYSCFESAIALWVLNKDVWKCFCTVEPGLSSKGALLSAMISSNWSENRCLWNASVAHTWSSSSSYTSANHRTFALLTVWMFTWWQECGVPLM